jgi:hypothetical protein
VGRVTDEIWIKDLSYAPHGHTFQGTYTSINVATQKVKVIKLSFLVPTLWMTFLYLLFLDRPDAMRNSLNFGLSEKRSIREK